MARLACFKSYDVRGQVPRDLDPAMARRIGLAYAAVVQPAGPVAVGRDIRESSLDLAAALIEGLNAGGVATRELGLCGTEMVYHAAAQEGMGGGIMVTASHNPRGDNGLKLVYRDPRDGTVRPVTAEDGLDAMEERVRLGNLPTATAAANQPLDLTESYLEQVLSFVRGANLQPLKVVVNAGNGCAGPVVDRLASRLPFELVRVHHEPDGTFPHGVPNPLLPENRAATAEAVVASGADLGVAWDGDFDRCFLFDHTGGFVEGYYIVGLLAEALLARVPGGRIVHDPRLYWNTWEVVAQTAGGTTLKCRTGHARIKAMMAAWDCLYGGEMSAHHYFRDFHYCDSGMVPWLLVAALMSETGRSLRELVGERIDRFPCSGEINREVADPASAFRRLLDHYAGEHPQADFFDGLSMTFATWRLNLRSSDTQPELLRLNIETRADRALLERRTAEVLELLEAEL
ncbi:MAG: phosphomannomutase [Armatimonadetes bacterium]|nr:phosphomannomutase [Armatimonadota bacterium]